MTNAQALEVVEELAALVARHPLPAGWAVTDSFCEGATAAGLQLELVGLVAQGLDSRGEVLTATGSAAELGSRPIERAYYELLERTYLLQALGAPRAWPVVSAVGAALRTIEHLELFPPVPTEAAGRVQYAKSNGVALGPSFEFAAARARLELLERDAVLRTWYGQGRPRSAQELASGVVQPELEIFYDVRLYDIPGDGVFTGVAVAFPKVASAPLLLGFAAREHRDEAVSAAYAESLQRLGFLWGEDIPESEPPFATTPDYHQELYLWPAKAQALRAWLSGDHERYQDLLPAQTPIEIAYVVLGSGGGASGVFAVKAVSAQCLPLVFGSGHPGLPELPLPLRTHPIA